MPSLTNQIVIPKGGKLNWVAVWKLHAMPLKSGINHPKCKVAIKCLNVLVWVEVVERNKDGPLPSPAILRIVSVYERKPW